MGHHIDDDIFQGNERHQVYVSLNLITSVFGVFASVITIILILRMKATTGHVYLVLLMSWYQLMYDLTFFFSVVPCGYYVSVTANVFQAVGGVASSFVSNWIAFIAMYIVWYRQKVDVFGNLRIIHLSSFFPGFVSAAIYFVATVPKQKASAFLIQVSIVYLYNNLRLLSIFLNFVFVAFIILRIYRTKGNVNSPQEIAIRTLARRMIYYPIIQAIGRSGYSWYEYAYGTNFGGEHVGNVEYASMIFAAIVTPSVSVGYLIIFLLMQPNAKKEFKALMLCQEVSEAEEEIASVPSFTSNNSSRTSKKSSEVAFDARLEYNPDPELELNPHGVRSTDSNVFSLSSWSRKSFGTTQSQAQHTTPVAVDMRDDDELFAILEEAEEEDELEPGQNASERFSSFAFSVASFMPRLSSRPSQNPPSSFTDSSKPKDGSFNANNSSISGAHVDVENVVNNNSVYVTENILHQTPPTSN